jgi:hypothetical protein
VFWLIPGRKAWITTVGTTEVNLASIGLNVSGMAEFEFKVLACHNAHVRLMNNRENYTSNFIEIVIGVANNAYISIRDKKYAAGSFNFFNNFLDCYTWKSFRICAYYHPFICIRLALQYSALLQ